MGCESWDVGNGMWVMGCGSWNGDSSVLEHLMCDLKVTSSPGSTFCSEPGLIYVSVPPQVTGVARERSR